MESDWTCSRESRTRALSRGVRSLSRRNRMEMPSSVESDAIYSTGQNELIRHILGGHFSARDARSYGVRFSDWGSEEDRNGCDWELVDTSGICVESGTARVRRSGQSKDWSLRGHPHNTTMRAWRTIGSAQLDHLSRDYDLYVVPDPTAQDRVAWWILYRVNVIRALVESGKMVIPDGPGYLVGLPRYRCQWPTCGKLTGFEFHQNTNDGGSTGWIDVPVAFLHEEDAIEKVWTADGVETPMTPRDTLEVY